MDSSPLKAVSAVAALLLVAVGVWLFDHYRDAYRITIHPPNESWLRDLPWDLAEMYGESAPYVQESLFYVSSEAGVLSLKQTVHPFTSTEAEPFERGFESAVRKRTNGSVRRCAPVVVETDSWTCFEWSEPVDGEPARHRSYLTGRGVSKLVVTFSAVEGRFGILGSPERWLREYVEWQGPSVLYAYY